MSLEEKKEDKVKDPVWLTSFMDVLFILIAFFTLYLSLTTISYPPEISVFFRAGSIFKGSNRTKIELPDISPHLAESVMKKNLSGEGVGVRKGREGEIVLLFSGRLLFEKGGYKIKGFVSSLNKLAGILKKLPAETKVTVVAHTHDWELSAMQAISVVKYLLKTGVRKEMLRAAGVVDTQSAVAGKKKTAGMVEIKVYFPPALVTEEKG